MTIVAACAFAILRGLLCPGSSTLADEPGRHLEIVGHLGGSPNALTVRDGYLYAAIGPELAVLDVSGVPLLNRVGYLLLPDMVRDVALVPSQDYACVASDQAGLAIVDIGQPATPRLIARVDTPGYAHGVVVAGEYAYVADDYSLRVVSISHPAEPFEAGVLHVPGRARSVAIAGRYAYVGQLVPTGDISYAGLLIVDISDPGNPVPLGSLEIPEFAAGVGVAVAPSKRYAYVAAGMGGLRVVDISDPKVPLEVGTWKPSQAYPNGWQVEVRGDLLFLADAGAGLFVLDVSDPTAPVEVAAYGDAGRVEDVDVAGTSIYLATSRGLLVLDASDPAVLTPLADQPLPVNPERLAVGDAHMYASGGHDMWVVDISDPAAPMPVGSAVFDRHVQGIALAEQANAGYLLVASGDCDGGQCAGAVSVLDVTTPEQPWPVGSYQPEAGYAIGVDAVDGLAYLAARDAGMWVLDVGNLERPRRLAALPTAGFAMDISVQGDYAYLADRGGGLRIVDISQPRLLAEAGVYQPPDEAWSVTVAGNIAFVGVRTFGLRAVDISQPDSPRELGSFETWPGLSVEDVAAAGGTVLVAAGFDGLRMIDMSDPSAPVEVGVYDTPGIASAVAVASDEVCVADGLGGLFILHWQ